MKLYINGNVVETECKTLYQIRNQRYPDKQEREIVSIINGYEVAEDVMLAPEDQIVYIEKGIMPSKKEFECMMCARYMPDVYEKIKNAYVAVAGLGGLGSNIAILLARTGVGHLHLLDYDRVEPSNLNRQQYRIQHLGIHKADALKQQIKEINPFIEVQIDNVFVNENNCKQLFETDEIICEAFDNPDSKAMLVNSLLVESKDKKIVAASGMAGYKSCNSIITKRIMDGFYLCGDEKTEVMPENGLMAPRVAACAAHQANMVLRLILNEKEA